MRIEGTSSLDPRGPLDGERPAAQAKPAEALTPPTQGDPERQVKLACAKYIQGASQSEEIDTQAVDRARKLLSSGDLDTPQAAQAAAEAILDLGI